MVVPLESRVDPLALIRLLADGVARAPDRIVRELGVSREALEQALERLTAQGLPLGSPRGIGLPAPVELLDRTLILAAAGAAASSIHDFEVLFEIDSTNSRLLLAPPPPPGRANVCIAELQTSGRGRRGRRWIAPFGHSIALSLAWAFGNASRANPALSLAVGVAALRALERNGARGIGLKWPNDLWLDDRKVGGVLLEVKTDGGGPTQVVIGIGINLSLPAAARREIESTGTSVAAVADACRQPPGRNATVGILLAELLSMLRQFEHEGFAPLRDAWLGKDVLRDRPAVLQVGGAAIRGTARGVDSEGALMLENGGKMQRFVSGEVSLRGTLGDT